jgi:hypothetical protein
MNSINKIKSDFEAIELMKLFEIEVTNKETGEQDWIIFDISISGRTMYAQHVALTKKQEKSKKIAFVKIVLDPIFTLDQHLQDLHEACMMAISDSDFFELV